MDPDDGFRIGPEGEKILHGFGDSYAHVRTDGSGKMYSAGFGHLVDSVLDWVRGIFGLPPKHDPDNPYVNRDQYRAYLGALYDGFSELTQKTPGGKPMGRQQFVDRMMKEVANLPDKNAQEDAVKRIVQELEAQQ